MNKPSAAGCRADAIVAEIDGHVPDIRLAGDRSVADRADILELDLRALADNGGILPALYDQEFGVETGRNNEFMTVFSHELRNSLGAIRSATDILRMEMSASPIAVKARTLIERQAGQMRRLVEDLLDISRIRNGRLRLRCEEIDLCAVAAQAAQTVEFTLLQSNQRLTMSFPETPVLLRADPDRLQQVFVNCSSTPRSIRILEPGYGCPSNGTGMKPSFAFATRASGSLPMSSCTCLSFSFRRTHRPCTRTRVSASASPWCAVWWNVTVGTSRSQAQGWGREASSRFACRHMGAPLSGAHRARNGCAPWPRSGRRSFCLRSARPRPGCRAAL